MPSFWAVTNIGNGRIEFFKIFEKQKERKGNRNVKLDRFDKIMEARYSSPDTKVFTKKARKGEEERERERTQDAIKRSSCLFYAENKCTLVQEIFPKKKRCAPKNKRFSVTQKSE